MQQRDPVAGVPGGPYRHEREFARDFTTPQGALLALGDAYRSRDVEAVVAAKDFRAEAAFLLVHHPDAPSDPAVRADILAGVAAELEASFRHHFARTPVPDTPDTEAYFSAAEPFLGDPDVVVVTEVTAGADGHADRHRMLVARTPAGWRGLVPAERYERAGGRS